MTLLPISSCLKPRISKTFWPPAWLTRAFLLVFGSLQIFVQVCHLASLVLERLCFSDTLPAICDIAKAAKRLEKKCGTLKVRAWRRLFVCASFNVFLLRTDWNPPPPWQNSWPRCASRSAQCNLKNDTCTGKEWAGKRAARR